MRVVTSTAGIEILREDDIGIAYLIENAQQFWSELDDLLRIPASGTVTLSLLDTTLRRFVSLCASYHEQYLQSPLQLEHACHQLLDSELFTFHSERMRELIAEDIQVKTDPHVQLILFNILLYFGRRQLNSLRSHKRWEPLIPILMDHILVEIDLDSEFVTLPPLSLNNENHRQTVMLGPITIEAKLRALGINLLYQVCRVQKLSEAELGIFSDSFIDSLFELVEQTRFLPDETLNYSVIKLLVAINEQFMVARLGTTSSGKPSSPREVAFAPGVRNRLVDVLISRMGFSKTFGENMIYMLNRATQSSEDLCMQLLVLKLLYILFTSKGTSEFFYTNDLFVLVDVFLRQLIDLGEDNESLRQTYLRVLHPLLTKTQLRNTSYKRPQLVKTLEMIIRETQFRDVNSTTKRLVERCLSGDWCIHLRRSSPCKDVVGEQDASRQGSPSSETIASAVHDGDLSSPPLSATLERSPPWSKRQLKASRSIDNMKAVHSPRLGTDSIRRPSSESADSFSGLPSTTPVSTKSTSSGLLYNGAYSSQCHLGSSSAASSGSTHSSKLRRPPPPPPKKRGMPPTTVGMTNGGATITAIATSVSARH